MSDGSLLERAATLTSEVSWVQEYHDRWLRIAAQCKAQLNMCHENKKGDPHAIDALTSTVALSEIKAEKCAAWLLEKKPKLAALMKEVDPDVVEN